LRGFIAKIDAQDISHRGAVMQAVFGLRVRHVEPLLREVDAQHPFDPDRRAAPFARGVMGLNQGLKCCPGNDNLHLGQEALSPCLLAGAIKAEAREASLLHGGHAQRVNGRGATESENQTQATGLEIKSEVP